MQNMLTEKQTSKFWKLVDKQSPSSCWSWLGYKNDAGYGIITIGTRKDYRKYRAHRISYQLVKGPVADSVQILHKCDNPRCVNPGHLFEGNPTTNAQDKCNKGRQSKGANHGDKVREKCPRGERSYLCKTSEETVKKVRAMYENGLNYVQISEATGVKYDNVGHIIRRESWTHIP